MWSPPTARSPSAISRAYLLNPWALVLFAHNQAAALVTGTFAVTAVGAFYTLREVTSRSGAAVP